MKWEDLTLYDRMLQDAQNTKPGHLHAVTSRMLLQRLRAANPHRFVLTNRAAERVRDAMASYPEMIANNGEFAIPPFPAMWIEFDSRVMLHHELLSPVMGDGCDHRVGYLIDHNYVWVVAEGGDYAPKVSPLIYCLNRPMPFGDQKAMAEVFECSRFGLDTFLWGHTQFPYLSPQHQRALRLTHSVVLHEGALKLEREYPGVVTRTLRLLYRAGAGELRNIVALMLMMNQPSHVVSSYGEPRQRGLVRGKSVPFFGHSVVDINLDAPKKLLKPTRLHGTHASPRWHEVRGHFCHNRAAREAAHEHLWEQTEARKWECHCGGKRWWREVPEGRGTAAIGFVHQHRRVRTSADAQA